MSRYFVGFNEKNRKMYLTLEQLFMGLHVIGSSGSGKSKFLEWILRQFVRARQGFCLIDPHGELYDKLVEWLAFHDNPMIKQKIVLLNLSKGDYIKGFNPFIRAPGETGDIGVKVKQQVTYTMRAWGMEDTDETPLLGRWLTNIYRVLVEKGETINSAKYLIDFFEEETRAFLASDVSDSLVEHDFRGLGRTPKQFHDELGSAKNKLRRFLDTAQVRRFMGLQTDNIDIRQCMDEGKIVLVNLRSSDEFDSEDARMFGALFVNEFFQQAQRREQDRLGNYKPYFLVLDEFQEFVNKDIGKILDQTRKFGLRAILSHQRLGHLEDEQNRDVFDAIMTNVHNRAIFGGLPYDAACTMVDNAFDLDPDEIKSCIWQTKFWQLYSRDKVRGYTKSFMKSFAEAYGETSAEAVSDLIGSSSATALHLPGGGAGLGAMIPMFAGAGDPMSITDTTAQMKTRGGSKVKGSGRTTIYGDAKGEAFTEIDVPIILPIPMREISSKEYRGLDEQRHRMAIALRNQYPRHCFFQQQEQATQPLLVPFVERFPVSLERLERYLKEVYALTNASPRSEVDAYLESEQKRIDRDMQEWLVSKEEEPQPELDEENFYV